MFWNSINQTCFCRDCLHFCHCHSLGWGLIWFVHTLEVDDQVDHKLLKLDFRQRFCEEIRDVPDTSQVFDSEVPLANAVPEPKETHVHAF